MPEPVSPHTSTAAIAILRAVLAAPDEVHRYDGRQRRPIEALADAGLVTVTHQTETVRVPTATRCAWTTWCRCGSRRRWRGRPTVMPRRRARCPIALDRAGRSWSPLDHHAPQGGQLRVAGASVQQPHSMNSDTSHPRDPPVPSRPGVASCPKRPSRLVPSPCEPTDPWAEKGTARALAIKVGVTVAGPLVILAGVAMPSCRGRYWWRSLWARPPGAGGPVGPSARTMGTSCPRSGATLPKDGSRGRRALGAFLVAAIAVAGSSAQQR